MPDFRVGLNPLPWVLTADGFILNVPVLRDAFAEIATTPFLGIHADPPPEQDADAYRALLAEYRLHAAPGYFSADFAGADSTGIREIVERAKRHSGVQAELGNTEVFLAAKVGGERTARPAVGAGADEAVLARVVDGIGAAAEVISAEGLRPALHPHVGSVIEIEDEIRTVLDAVPGSVLGFGPDTGHLAWAGMDPAAIMREYADRIAAVHLKDVHLDEARKAREAGADYREATRGAFTVWTEPGRGEVDLDAALATLPAAFDGWVMVEVDVPEAATNIESTRISAAWVTEHLGAAVFG